MPPALDGGKVAPTGYWPVSYYYMAPPAYWYAR
jgi:hypothetical protein